MKKIITPGFLLVGMLMVFGCMYGQKNTMTTDEMAGQLTEWMTTNLQLTSVQVDPVQAINLKYANKMAAVQKSPDTKAQKLRALKADGDARDQELKRVLSADQYQAWLVKKEEAQKMIKEKIKEKKAGG
jgi:hypothetical protein